IKDDQSEYNGRVGRFGRVGYGRGIGADAPSYNGRYAVREISEARPFGERDLHKIAETLRPEWVIRVAGRITARPDNMKNPNEPTGEIEVKVSVIEVLAESKTPPFDLASDGREINEESRMRYRYLDLRRPRLKKNLVERARVVKFVRDFLTERGFIEIETPILSKSTPEGARDYLVPSRVDAGNFYAL